MRPQPSDYATFYARYIDLVIEDDVMAALQSQSSETQKLLAALDEEKATHRYAEGKWSVKQVVGHLTDAERVFGYRALCIARGEETSLPGFDEQTYVETANFDAWKVGDLAEMYALVRRSNIVMFRNLPKEAWQRRGVANDAEVTVNALAHMIVGHERHHLNVLRERYKI